MLNNIQKTAIVMYFVFLCPQISNVTLQLLPPSEFKTGDNIKDFRSFVSGLLLPQHGSFIPLDDIIDLVGIYFKQYTFTTRNEIIKHLTDLPAKFKINYIKNKTINNKTGCLSDITFNSTNVERLKANLQLLNNDGTLSSII